jgi:hypothetical protein
VSTAKFSCILGRDSEFWPLLECLLILLKRLESRFWQHANTGSQTDLFVLVVLHPAYLNEMKMLPGYNGGDKDIDAKPSDETSRLDVKLRLHKDRSLSSNGQNSFHRYCPNQIN